MEISKIGIITHPNVKKNIIRKTLKKTRKKNTTILLDPQTAAKAGGEGTNVKDMHVDLAIIIGGDGTLLWAINELPKSPLLLGINTGRIGYLTELEERNLGNLEKIHSGGFHIDERTKLRINDRYEALNEIVILPKRPAALAEFSLKIDGEKIPNFRADGILVSTQTGSTGHALSLGGPVIHPKTDAYLIAPIIPYMREQAPMIVPGKTKTSIQLTGKEKEARMILDGNTIKEIEPGSETTITKSKNTARFVRFTENKWKQATKKQGDRRPA
ncbi:MAG: NAD(+)/NADH kinase [Candidatus Altiarchaeota archaeon]|nr:NAD(+)/NADH kinase [Candidatus Altiarchaeota archaeon]